MVELFYMVLRVYLFLADKVLSVVVVGGKTESKLKDLNKRERIFHHVFIKVDEKVLVVEKGI